MIDAEKTVDNIVIALTHKFHVNLSVMRRILIWLCLELNTLKLFGMDLAWGIVIVMIL